MHLLILDRIEVLEQPREKNRGEGENHPALEPTAGPLREWIPAPGAVSRNCVTPDPGLRSGILGAQKPVAPTGERGHNGECTTRQSCGLGAMRHRDQEAPLHPLSSPPGRLEVQRVLDD